MVAGRSRLRIASRGSRLALWQANAIRRQLLDAHPGLDVVIEVVRTTGDRVLDVPLAMIGDRGLFTKEIDDRLLAGGADLAVHSLKDVPTRLHDRLTLAAVAVREDPRDVLVLRPGEVGSLDQLSSGARVGTSSLRRRSQLRHLRKDLDVIDLRGNIDTRLAKLDAGDYDAIILAAAGLLRLGWRGRITQTLPIDLWLPAVGQGALAVVARGDDSVTVDLVRPLHHPPTACCIAAERSFLASLEGGCQVPIGAFAEQEGDRLRIDGLVSDLAGDTLLRDHHSGVADEAIAVGAALAQKLIRLGANEILRAIRNEPVAPAVSAP